MITALASAQPVEARESRQWKPTSPSDSTPPQMSRMPTQMFGLGASPNQAAADSATSSGATPRMIG
jgi:hypothetical protein